MNKTLHSISLLFILYISMFCSYACNEKNGHEKRVYFQINPKNRQIVLTVSLNDSITARLGFDTGGQFILDSTFCANHPDVRNNLILDTVMQNGSGWATHWISSSIYTNAPTVKIGDTKLIYDGVSIQDWKGYMNTSSSEGMLNIPYKDTTHVWELNFEHNYLEVHPGQDFEMPENCFIFPLIKKDNYPTFLYVELPLKVKCNDKSTITMKRKFMIGTGMAWDMVLMHKTEEFDILNKQGNVVWTEYLNTYYRYCPVEATLSESFKMDSLRIYTFDYINNPPFNYLIGQNFLKRFNVFFDMKHMKIGLQPLPNFQRIINPLHKRFHISIKQNLQKKWIVTKVANNKENYYKKAGLREGDEVKALNGKPYKKYTYKEYDMLEEQGTLIYDILRKGKPLKITVIVDKNEVQGD